MFTSAGRLLHVKWIFPNAPNNPVTINMGMRMPSWYDIYSLGNPDAKQDEEGIMKSVGMVHGLVEKEVESGIPAERIVVGGFSQGCAVALLSGLTCNRKLGAIVGFSGYIPMREKVSGLLKNRDSQILLCHGEDDPVVRYEFGVATKELLTGLGLNVTWKSYPDLEHSASPAELEYLGKFLESKIKGNLNL
jgi:predicted esterase